VSSTPAVVGRRPVDDDVSSPDGDRVQRHGRAAAGWLVGVVGFTGLAVVLTWPWAAELWHGAVGGDAAQFVWDAWWVKERVVALQNPWWTGLLYAPEGTYLAAHPLETLLMVLLAPVTAIGGPMVAYGLLVLATITAAGVLTWRLGLAIGLGAVGSWVAGLLWASSPIVVHRTSTGLYMLLLLAALLPAAVLLALRLVHRFTLPSAIALGGLLGACLLTDLQVTAYLVLAVSAVGVYAVATKPRWRSRAALVRVGVVAAVFLALGMPVLAMTVRAETDGTYRTPTAARVASATAYSGDAAQLLLPSPASRFFHSGYERAADALGSLSNFTIDSSIALGWAATTLALIGVVATRRSRRTWWLAGAVVVCAVLSVGPTLKAFGHLHTPLAVDLGEEVSLLSPSTWLLGVPVLNDLRNPARYMQLGALPLVLLAGLGAQALVRRHRIAGTALVAGFCVLGVAEGAVALQADSPQGDRLARTIRDDPRPGIVVDVPLSWRSGIDLVGSPLISSRAMVAQTIHGKPIAAGYIARLDRAMLDRLTARPLYRSLLLRQRDGDIPAGLAMPDRKDVIADAERIGAHWIVVWPEADRKILPYLSRLGYRRLAAEDGVVLYGDRDGR
jgi:hypothetical protein